MGNFLIDLLLASVITLPMVTSHGRLWTPPARNTMWRRGFQTPIDYQDNELFCGGFTHQWDKNNGRCGVCGDAWDAPKQNEAVGRYATGTIAAKYSQGQKINVVVDITAHHKGWFEFRLCPVNDKTVAATHECLNKHPIPLADGSGNRYMLPDQGSKKYVVALRLPADVTCDQCVLQWKYNAGNSWGCSNHTCCVGCGKQEQFYGCSDIKIIPANGKTTSQVTDAVTMTTATDPVTITTRKVTQEQKTTSRPVETTTKGSSGHHKCFSIHPYNRLPGMDKWCERNCARNFCPRSHCACDGDDPIPSCYPVGAYVKVPGMKDWCITNCAQNFCPRTHCACDRNRRKRSLVTKRGLLTGVIFGMI